MVDLRLRVRFKPGTQAFVLIANRGAYTYRGAAANLNSSTRTPIAYALTCATGIYHYSGKPAILTWTQPGVSQAAPQALWQGMLNSQRVQMVAWPPADGSLPDGYNFYRTDMPLGPNVPLNSTLRVPFASDGGSNTIFYAAFTDLTVAPATSYSYYCTAVKGTSESSPSPQLSVVTLGATGNTPPTPVIAPETYITTYTPTPLRTTNATNTVWLATLNLSAQNPISNPTAGTNNGINGKLSVNCSLMYAIQNAVAGDTIVLTAGVTYQTNYGVTSFPFTCSGCYICSDQDPYYNPAGKLTYCSLVTSTRYTPITFTAPPAANATSATLTKRWVGKPGWYTVRFRSTNPSKIESKQCLFQLASTSVVWDIGLQAGCSVNAQVCYANWVTPWDAGVPCSGVSNSTPTMAIIQWNNGNGSTGITVTGNNNRFVGILVQPQPSLTSTIMFASFAVSGDGNMIDRCISGRNNLVSTWSKFFRGFLSSGTHSVFHQCYAFGVDSGPGGTDVQAFYHQSKGPIVVQNCYLEGVEEGFFTGGGYVPQAAMTHDAVVRYSFSHKPTCWYQVIQLNTGLSNRQESISSRVKNLIELKCTLTFAWYGNIFQNSAFNFASFGQQGRAMPLTARDQVSTNAAQGLASLTADGAGTATGTLKFSFPMADQVKFVAEIAGATNAAFNGKWPGATMQGNTGLTFTFPITVGVSGPAGGTAVTLRRVPQCGGMWESIFDGNIYDNQNYAVAQAIYFASSADGNPALHLERIWYHNNLTVLNPAFQDFYNPAPPGWSPPASVLVGSDFQGATPDLKYNANTLVSIVAGTGFSTSTISSGFRSLQSGTLNTLLDRGVVTDNIMDTTHGVYLSTGGGTNPPHFGNTGGAAVQWIWNTANLVWNQNIFIKDTSPTGSTPPGTAFPATTYNPIAYSALGTELTIDPTDQPDDVTLWNITSGPYVNAATDGGPIGTQFLGPSFQSDLFPRLRLQVLTGAGYTNGAFQTTAGLFNIVDFGVYAGIENDQGATMASIFKTVKINGRANGLYTRTLLYTNPHALATAANNGGNGATFSVWIGTVNATNWWIRGSAGGYPSGPIVASTNPSDPAGTGLLATTSQNTVLSAGGRTFAQGFWDHYDGIFRLGQGVAQGYAANKSFAVNPYVDGYQIDNFLDQPRQNGSWGMDTTVYTQHYGTSADPTLSTWIQQSYASIYQAVKAVNPRLQIMANADYFVRSTTNFSYQVALDPSQKGLLDMVYCQAAIGIGGIEGQGTTTTAQMMANLIAAEAQMAPGGTLIFEQSGVSHNTAFSSSNQASWTATDWKGARFGMACACMRDWHYELDFSETYSAATVYLMDEFGPQGGIRSWLGSPFEQPQSAARFSGVWYRVFCGGVVFMNPKGNGSQTINLSVDLGLSNLKAIANIGFGDATINTGLAVSSITLADRDGRFLIFG